MNTTIVTASAAVSFFSNIHHAGNPLPRFTLEAELEADLVSVPNGREAKFDEADAIRFFVGNYRVWEPHGTQLDMARYVARVTLDPSFAEPENRVGMIIAELTSAEKELLRRWRNYERRATLARQELRDLNAEILEKTESGDIPTPEECAQRATLVAEVEFWGQRAQNPLEYPIEVDQWVEPLPYFGATLDELVADQRADQREWNKRTGGFQKLLTLPETEETEVAAE